MAFMDKQQWEEAITTALQSSGTLASMSTANTLAIIDIVDERSAYYCLVDASWIPLLSEQVLNGPYSAKKVSNCYMEVLLYPQLKQCLKQKRWTC
ncbi:unnamed protein product [Thlaspi arvense]|uniref:Uncharacterized protein n=1 Tax=Thlaspi arvense TaxID=13288 RepID=A0AAU9T9H3_THLAR|nr:unnamed protein product [Thlaspi arvense]